MCCLLYPFGDRSAAALDTSSMRVYSYFGRDSPTEQHNPKL